MMKIFRMFLMGNGSRANYLNTLCSNHHQNMMIFDHV